jgi:hypothetical protein
MKSRYDVLNSASDRRQLAMFRSSSAVGVVLSLLVVAALVAHQPATDAPAVNLFSAEVGMESRAVDEQSAERPEQPRMHLVETFDDDVREYPPHWIEAPGF